MSDSLASLKRFMRSVFWIGPVCGAIATVAHVAYLQGANAWDPAISLFQAVVLFFGISFTVPTGLSIVRMTWFGMNESVHGREMMERTGAKLESFVERFSDTLDEKSVEESKEILRDIRDFVRPEMKSPAIAPADALARLRSLKPMAPEGGNGR